MGAVPLSLTTGADPLPTPMRFALDWGSGYDLWVLSAGLACCAVEFVAAATRREIAPLAPDRPADGSESPDSPRHHVMVVSGTVTDKLAPAIMTMYDQLPEPRHVISFGSCANSGGPYWDSYCVTKGVDQLVPVDVYIPGCPPRPEALLEGIRTLQAAIAQGGIQQGAIQQGAVEPVAIEDPDGVSR